MWFKVLGLVVAGVVLAKSITGLVAPERFYAGRRRQYASPRLPAVVVVLPLFFAVLTVLAWYATVFHPVPWGWALTALLTAGVLLGAINLARWKTHRLRGLRAVTNPTLCRRIDLGLLAFGGALAAFAVFVT